MPFKSINGGLNGFGDTAHHVMGRRFNIETVVKMDLETLLTTS
jgi:hypothetical protein